MSEFRLPDVGEGLESAEIVEWLVSEGDRVERDQPLVEILTDKSQTQLPSPRNGVIVRLGFAEGDIAQVGQVIVEFEEVAGVSAASVSDPAPSTTAPPPPVRPATAAAGRPKAAPVTRRRALEAGIDLAAVAGTGPGGRITNADLDAFESGSATQDPTTDIAPATSVVAAPKVQTAPVRATDQLGQMDRGTHPLRGIRRVTAEAMTRSWQIPHIHGNDEADATELLEARRRMRERDPEGAAQLTPLAFFVLAVANGLRRYPLLNASIDPAAGTITVHDAVNIGVAVASPEGLSVPVIRNADQRSLFNLAAEISRLSTAVRDRTVTTTDLQGGTATISNYGSLGGRFATPIIRSPEVLIVGFGSIKPRPFVVGAELAVRPTLPISIAVDHRLIDGDLMTAFQEYVIEQLTDPVSLLAR